MRQTKISQGANKDKQNKQTTTEVQHISHEVTIGLRVEFN